MVVEEVANCLYVCCVMSRSNNKPLFSHPHTHHSRRLTLFLRHFTLTVRMCVSDRQQQVPKKALHVGQREKAPARRKREEVYRLGCNEFGVCGWEGVID